MSLSGHAHIGDVRRIRARVMDNGLPVVLTDPVTIRLLKPDGTSVVDKTATIDLAVTAGNEAYCTTGANDLDQIGTWKIQLKDGAGPWRTDVGEFEVKANLGTGF